MKKRILPILLALIMALTLLPTLALADNETVNIDSNEDLVTAIKNQADGQTWVFTEAGEYDAKNTEEGSNGTYKFESTYAYPFAFPIVANNITITKAEGVGEVTITSSYEATTANWHDQNFITVYGTGLTIDGVNILGNKNTAVDGNGEKWYGGLCNKAIEFTPSASNFTLKNMEVKSLVNEAGKKSSGSIYVSCTNVGTSSIENVKMGSYISSANSVEGTLTIKNLEQDYTDFIHANEPDYLYGVKPAAAENLVISGLTIYVDNTANLAEQVFVNNATSRIYDGTTVVFAEGEYDIGSLRINKAVNLVGAGGADTVLNGSVDYNTAAENAVINISGLFFEAEGTNTNHALNFSALKDSEINVTDCDFKGYQFGIGVNSGATRNTLNVSESEFAEVNCAAGIKVGDADNDVTFTNVDTWGGFAVQAFSSLSGQPGYNVNAYYKDYISYYEDKDAGFQNPDYNALENPATLVTPSTFEAALENAEAGDTLILAPGTYETPANKWFTTPVNIIGSGAENTIIEGALWLGGGNSVPVNNVTTLTVKEVTFKNTEGVNNWSTVGLGFVQIYGCDITVENCVFDGWQYGVHMNGTNTGTVLNFVNVDFKNTFVAISAQLDSAEIGTIENVTTTENAFAVQAFGGTADYNYYTLADFNTARAGSTETGINDLDNSKLAEGIAYENGGGMLRGYVLTNGDNVQDAIDKLPESGKSYIVLTPGSYDGFTVDKSLTILGANAGTNPNEESHGPLSRITGKVTINGYTDGTKPTVVFDGVAFVDGGCIWSQNGHGFCGVNLTVQNCKAVNISDHFVYTTNPSTDDYRNGTIKIINNYVSGVHNATGTASAFNLWYAEEHIIMGNVVESVDYNAFNLNDTVGDVTFIENKISNVGQNGFQIANSAAEGALVEIGNNVFTNVDGNAIYFLGHSTDPAQIKSDISILNNRMNGCGGAIVFEKVSSVNAEAEDNFADGVPVGIVFKDSGDVNVANVNVLVDGVVVYASSGKVPYSIQLPAAPSKPGYIFMGWKGSDGHTHQANETVTVEKDMTFTAVWSNLPDIEPGEPDEPDVPDFPFTDVSVNAWYYEAVKYVYENGIMNGMDRYSFQPNGTLTRAMVWTMLARLDGVDTEGGNSWYAKAQEWATANSVSDGENPTGEVTREQLVTMLYRYAQYKGYDVSIGEDTNILSYVDVDQVSDWAMEAFQWACGTGVIEGDENSALTPKASTTRAQAAAMFMRFIEL